MLVSYTVHIASLWLRLRSLECNTLTEYTLDIYWEMVGIKSVELQEPWRDFVSSANQSCKTNWRDLYKELQGHLYGRRVISYLVRYFNCLGRVRHVFRCTRRREFYLYGRRCTGVKREVYATGSRHRYGAIKFGFLIWVTLSVRGDHFSYFSQSSQFCATLTQRWSL